MKWVVYQLLFRVASPVHVGWRRVGNCWQCRPYLPAYPLLCALAARVTESGRRFQADKGNPYLSSLSWLKEHIRLTYFFPALQENAQLTVFFPFYREDGGLEYAKRRQGLDGKFSLSENDTYSAEEFDYLFMDAQSRTALSYPERTALTGALYHFEFLRPFTRRHEGLASRPVYLTGYVLIDEEARNKLLGDAGEKELSFFFDHLQVGGERQLGWGLLCLGKHWSCPDGEPFGFDFLGFLLSDIPGVKIKASSGRAMLLAHALPPGGGMAGISFKGPLEIMVKRESDFEKGRLCSGCRLSAYGRSSLFLPGSCVQAEKSGVYFKITDEGLWECF